MAEERARPSPGATTLRRLVVVMLLLLVSGFAGVFLAFPEARSALVRENGIIQTATAAVFAAAAIGGVVAIRVGRLVPRVYWLVPLVALLGFAGELRFGTRLPGIPTPSLGGRDVDSFHDLFEWAVDRSADLGVGTGHVTLLGVVAAAGLVVYLTRPGRLERITSWLIDHPPIATSLLALGTMFVGLSLDLAEGGPWVAFLEETAELASAALLVMAAVAVAERHGAVVSWRRFSLTLTGNGSGP